MLFTTSFKKITRKLKKLSVRRGGFKNVKDYFSDIKIALSMCNCRLMWFSKLKLIKHRLLENRLLILASLSIQSVILWQIFFKDIVSSFICMKFRRKIILWAVSKLSLMYRNFCSTTLLYVMLSTEESNH